MLTVTIGLSVKEILKDTNKAEESQTVAALCLCLQGETAEMWQLVRSPCWLCFISAASASRVGPPIGDTILIMFSGRYLHGSATVEDSTVAVITEYHFYQEPKAFDPWGHLTAKPSHILEGVMQ